MKQVQIIDSFRKLFKYYKTLGEQAMAQLETENLFWQANEVSNSIAIIVQHMAGNMLSRFTDFLESDGEKEGRNRDEEFETKITEKEALYTAWEKGWSCLFTALENLTDEDLNKVVFIRSQAHSVFEAIQRQLAHYASHIGQIIFIAKMLAYHSWKSLSIPKGQSSEFNNEIQSKNDGHFTDHALKK